jgi:acetyl/propionyl-CoA carboxylase alpha subunit
MQALLREYTLLGVTTNRQFLLDILASGAFTDGDTDTGFLERYFADWQPAVPLSNKILAVAALGETLQRRGRLPNAPALVAATRNASSPAPATPWQHYDGWRKGGTS